MPAIESFAALDSGEPGPLYWIYGKERFLVDRAVAQLKERVLDPRTRDFNYDLLYAKEAGPQKILAAARTLPMMARRRLVMVRDADALDAKQLEQLVPYVENPAPETCLLFVAEKVDSRIKFFGTFRKHGVLLRLDPLAERQLPGFLREEAKARKIRFEAGAAELIADEIGADLGQLVDAVERLELYVAAAGGEPARAIRVEDVEAVVSTSRQRSVFELSDAIGEGDVGRALAVLGSLLAAREPALKVLAMIGRLVRQLLQLRELIERRAARGEYAAALGLPPFVVDKLEAQARRASGEALRAMHAAVYRADRALKSTGVADERVMERLMFELAREMRRGQQRAGTPRRT
jgi:DNA polymerase-3 subunit delta